jgi:serine/threonine-protein kinase
MFEYFQGGRYKVIKRLGERGKGIIFTAEDTRLGRAVAVKVIKVEGLDPEGLLRLQREVQAMARLMHPNVVTVFDIGQEGGRHYLLLELMEGGDVEHLIASSPGKRLDATTAVRIGKEVARALEHTHGTIRPHQALGYLTPQQYLLQYRHQKEDVSLIY